MNAKASNFQGCKSTENKVKNVLEPENRTTYASRACCQGTRTRRNAKKCQYIQSHTSNKPNGMPNTVLHSFFVLFKEPPRRKSACKIHKARKHFPVFMLTIYVSCEVHFHARQLKERKSKQDRDEEQTITTTTNTSKVQGSSGECPKGGTDITPS